MSYIVKVERTQNKFINKFEINKFITNHLSFEYNNIDDAKNSQLAQELFYLPFVKKVYITPSFISIERFNIVEWEDVEEEVKNLKAEIERIRADYEEERKEGEFYEDPDYEKARARLTAIEEEHKIQIDDLNNKIDEYQHSVIIYQNSTNTFGNVENENQNNLSYLEQLKENNPEEYKNYIKNTSVLIPLPPKN